MILTYEEIEEYANLLDRVGRIKLEISKKSENIIRNSNIERAVKIVVTFATYNGKIGVKTLTEGGSLYCIIGRRRSQLDLFRLSRRYKNMSFLEFKNALKSMIKNRIIFSHNCPDIKKRVFVYNHDKKHDTEYDRSMIGNANHMDEFGHYWKDESESTLEYCNYETSIIINLNDPEKINESILRKIGDNTIYEDCVECGCDSDVIIEGKPYCEDCNQIDYDDFYKCEACGRYVDKKEHIFDKNEHDIKMCRNCNTIYNRIKNNYEKGRVIHNYYSNQT